MSMFDQIKQKMDEIEAEYKSGHATPRTTIQKIINLTDETEFVATVIADEHLMTITTGDYGSGRTYYPKGHEYWDEEQAYDYGNGGSYWMSSSESC